MKVLVHLVTPPSHSNMQRVVAADLGISCLAPTVVGLQERLTFMGYNKVQDHCGSSRKSSLVKHMVAYRRTLDTQCSIMEIRFKR